MGIPFDLNDQPAQPGMPFGLGPKLTSLRDDLAGSPLLGALRKMAAGVPAPAAGPPAPAGAAPGGQVQWRSIPSPESEQLADKRRYDAQKSFEDVARFSGLNMVGGYAEDRPENAAYNQRVQAGVQQRGAVASNLMEKMHAQAAAESLAKMSADEQFKLKSIEGQQKLEQIRAQQLADKGKAYDTLMLGQLQPGMPVDPQRLQDLTDVWDSVQGRHSGNRAGASGGPNSPPVPRSTADEVAKRLNFDPSALIDKAVNRDPATGMTKGLNYEALISGLSNNQLLADPAQQEQAAAAIAQRLMSQGVAGKDEMLTRLGQEMIRRQNEAGFGGVRYGNEEFMAPRRVGDLSVVPFRTGNMLRGDAGYTIKTPDGRSIKLSDKGVSSPFKDFFPTTSADTRRKYQSEAAAISPIIQAMMRQGLLPGK